MNKLSAKTRTLICFLALFFLTMICGLSVQGKIMFQKRYLFIQEFAGDEASTNYCISLINRAAAVGYNGIVFYSWCDNQYYYNERAPYTNSTYFGYIKRIKDECEKLGLALIPFGLGQNDATISNYNISEAYPLTAKFTVGGDRIARATPDSGLFDLIRTTNRPVVVKSGDGSITYKEGTDYSLQFTPNTNNNFQTARGAQGRLTITSSSIKTGDALTVSWSRMVPYHARDIKTDFPATDYCEPAVWDSMTTHARYITTKLFSSPPAFFMNYDEWNCGYWDPNCKARGFPTAGSYIGGAINRTAKILRSICPDMEVYVWDDMLDLYDFNEPPDPSIKSWLWNGSFYGAWDSIPVSGPNNIVIMNWASKTKSKLFFAGKDPQYPNVKEHKQILVGYYNGWRYDNINPLLDSLEKLGCSDSAVIGFMYATYGNDYSGIEDQANGFKKSGRWGSNRFAFPSLHATCKTLGVAPSPQSITPSYSWLLKTIYNPFSSTGCIFFHIPENSRVQISLINTMGQTVKILLDQEHPRGNYKVNWNASGVPAGVYLIKLSTVKKNEATKERMARKIVLCGQIND